MSKSKRRKRRTREEIREEILKFLEKQTYPRTTGQIAEAVGIIWYKAHEYLNDLREEEIIYHEKVGRQNQWCLIDLLQINE